MNIDSVLLNTVKNELKKLNPGTVYFTTDSVDYTESVFVSYGMGYQRPMMDVGYEERVLELSVMCEKSGTNITKLRPNQNVFLVASGISASFCADNINSTNPVYNWIALSDRKDQKLNG
jgi:hypothetical protein